MRSVINAMAAGLMAVDATCMALLAISASRWEGTAAAARVDSAVMLLQLLALCGECWREGKMALEAPNKGKQHARCVLWCDEPHELP